VTIDPHAPATTVSIHSVARQQPTCGQGNISGGSRGFSEYEAGQAAHLHEYCGARGRVRCSQRTAGRAAPPTSPPERAARAWLAWRASAEMWTLLVCAVCSGARATPPASTPGEFHRTIEDIIKSDKVVVFSRSNCKESDEVKAMLEEYGIGYSLVELDMREDGQGIAKQLGHGSFSPKANPVAKAVGAVSVVPAVFVRGNPVSKGTLSQSYKSGELEHWASDDASSESDASSQSVPLLA
jgi:glutaredoxin